MTRLLLLALAMSACTSGYSPLAHLAERPPSRFDLEERGRLDPAAFAESDVDRAPQRTPGHSGPRYPQMLRERKVTGRVIVEFVVDTSGRADMGTYRVLEFSHDLFERAVRAYVAELRLEPALKAGQPVRVWVRTPFQFDLPPLRYVPGTPQHWLR